LDGDIESALALAGRRTFVGWGICGRRRRLGRALARNRASAAANAA